MADVQHSALTGANLHEPKGADSASNNTVYVSDGAGSGTWQKVTASGLNSESEQYGKILTADGSGGCAFDQKVWKDLIGSVVARGSGAGWPTYTSFIGSNVNAYAFAAGEGVNFYFHIPHDWAVGTDLFLHVHWTHNGTAISGNMQWDYEATYAKGHDQANFSTPVTGSITYNTVDIATTPQYRHRIDEIQLTNVTPSASQLDTDDIEIDGLIMVHISANTIPSITGGSPNEPFMLFADLHYQADMEGTLNKTPNFYA